MQDSQKPDSQPLVNSNGDSPTPRDLEGYVRSHLAMFNEPRRPDDIQCWIGLRKAYLIAIELQILDESSLIEVEHLPSLDDAKKLFTDLLASLVAQRTLPASVATSTPKGRKPKPIPAKFQKAYDLLPSYKDKSKDEGKRFTMAKFIRWLLVNHKIELEVAKFDAWYKSYTRTQRRVAQKTA